MEKENNDLRTLFKLSVPRYKWIITFCYMFLMSLLPLVHRISDITLLMDTYFCLLAIVFFADILLMEQSGRNIEIFKLKSYEIKRKILFIRILMNLLMLVFLSMVSYGMFFLIHKPTINQGDSIIYYFFISIIIVFMNSLIFGLLSYLFSNLFSNRWVGIGISIFIWYSLITQWGRSLPVPINLFLFGTRDQDGNPHPNAKLWIIGKIVVLILVIIASVIEIKWLEKRGKV